MKKSILSLLAMVAMVCTFASCNKTAQKSDTNDELSAMSDSVAMIQGYLTGQQFGQQFMMMAMQGMPVDSAEFLKGFKVYRPLWVLLRRGSMLSYLQSI